MICQGHLGWAPGLLPWTGALSAIQGGLQDPGWPDWCGLGSLTISPILLEPMGAPYPRSRYSQATWRMWVILWSWSRPGCDTTQVSGCPFMLRLGTRWNSEVTAAERECVKERPDVVPLTSVSQVTLGAGLPSAVQEAASVRPWPSSSAGPGFSEGRGGTADGGEAEITTFTTPVRRPRPIPVQSCTGAKFQAPFSSFISSTKMPGEWQHFSGLCTFLQCLNFLQ